MHSNEKLRILHYIGGLNIGGSQSMVMELYRHIDRDKIQFDFIVDKKYALFFKDEVEQLGGKVYILEPFKGYNYIRYIRQLKKFFKIHNEYKIIYGHVRSIASIYLRIAKKYGLITIAHSHSTSNGKGFSSIIKNVLQYRIRFIADYFVGCSYEANCWLFGKKNANSNKCLIINNAFNYNRFKFNLKYREKIRRKYNIKDNEILLGNVGRYIYAKNQKFLIDILEQLIRKNKNYKLMICGYGDLKEELIKYSKTKNIFKNILFVSPGDEVFKYYSAFDIFLFPSKYEGLGIVAVEAQVSGLPIILSTNVPKSVLISEDYKFLDINEQALNDWIKTIVEFTKNKGNNRNKKVKNTYDIEKEVKKIENLFFNIEKNIKSKNKR